MTMFGHGDASKEGSEQAEPIDALPLPEDITAAEPPASRLQAELLAGETGEPIEELLGDLQLCDWIV